jgi:hypothetical protein
MRLRRIRCFVPTHEAAPYHRYEAWPCGASEEVRSGGSDYRRATADFVETLKSVQKSPGMWGLHGAAGTTRYRTLIGFIEGIDIGMSRGFLVDFQRWFRARHGLDPRSNLTWFGEVSNFLSA